MREQLFAQHRVAAEHIAEQLLDFLPECAYHPDAGERLPDASVHDLHVFAHRAVDRTDPAREDETQHHHAGNDGERGEGELPIQNDENHDGDDETNRRDRR